MKIALDLDEIIFPFVENLIIYHNKNYCTNFKFEDIKHYELWKVWGGTREQAIKKVAEFQHTPEFDLIPPIPESALAIEELRKHNELIIVTSRREDMKDKTLAWIDKYFPKKFSGLYLTNAYALDGPTLNKADMCLENGSKLLVDDCLEFAKECSEKGIETWLWYKPWNQSSSLPYLVSRFKIWKEFLNIVQDIVD